MDHLEAEVLMAAAVDSVGVDLMVGVFEGEDGRVNLIKAESRYEYNFVLALLWWKRFVNIAANSDRDNYHVRCNIFNSHSILTNANPVIVITGFVPANQDVVNTGRFQSIGDFQFP